MYTNDEIKEMATRGGYYNDDDFNAAQEMLAQLLNERRWIPVTERLPEPEQMVDVYTNMVEGARYCDVEYLPDLKFPWSHDDLCDDCATLGIKVTHWMPIQPPQDK